MPSPANTNGTVVPNPFKTVSVERVDREALYGGLISAGHTVEYAREQADTLPTTDGALQMLARHRNKFTGEIERLATLAKANNTLARMRGKQVEALRQLFIAAEAWEQADHEHDECQDCGVEGPCRHCGPCILRFAAAISIRREALTATRAALNPAPSHGGGGAADKVAESPRSDCRGLGHAGCGICDACRGLRPPPAACTSCDGTGYKDHAGFAMDPCPCNRPGKALTQPQVDALVNAATLLDHFAGQGAGMMPKERMGDTLFADDVMLSLADAFGIQWVDDFGGAVRHILQGEASA